MVGSINADSTIACPSLPVTGETVVSTSREAGMGGKGANQAVAAARLGARVSLVALTGNDEVGQRARVELASEGVSVDGVAIHRELPTGEALVLREPTGANCIVVVPGANAALSPDHVVRFFNDLDLSEDDVVLVSAEIPESAIEAAMLAGHHAGATVLYNAAPFRPFSEWVDVVRPVLILNAVEAEQATGDADPITAMTVLTGLSRFAVITLGADGALGAGEGVPLVRAPAPLVTAVDTVGAGDAFCGALAWALVEGREPADAVKAAVVAGAIAVTGAGARGALARPDDLLPNSARTMT